MSRFGDTPQPDRTYVADPRFGAANDGLKPLPWEDPDRTPVKQPLTDEEFAETYATEITAQRQLLTDALASALATVERQNAALQSGQLMPVPLDTTPPLSPEQVGQRFKQLAAFIKTTQVGVREHRGALFATHIDLITGDVELELTGACVSCAATQYTMDRRIRSSLERKPELDWVKLGNGSVDQDMSKPQNRERGIGDYVPAF